jgi:hypothetical protein
MPRRADKSVAWHLAPEEIVMPYWAWLYGAGMLCATFVVVVNTIKALRKR